MVFNDDMSWSDEVKLGYFSNLDNFERLSNLWLLYQAYRHRRPSPDFSVSVRELMALNESCRKNGARLAVVVFRNNRIDSVWDARVRSVSLGLEGSGIPILDLGPALLKDHSEKELRVHEFDGHPNEIAHQVAAEEIERFLRSSKLISF
jgi:hypothetical protein